MQLLKSIQKNVPSPDSTRGEETKENVPTTDLKLSEQAITFPSKGFSQPCMSFMPTPGTQAMLWNKEKESQFKTSHKGIYLQLSADDFRRSLRYATWSEIRMKASIILEMIYRFDPAVNPDDSRILCDALNAINRAEAAA